MSVSIATVMSRKVVTVNSTSSAYDAVKEMMNHDIGCVLVVEGKKVVGIVTKGDILREVVMKRLDPLVLGVKSVMSQPVVVIDSNESLTNASSLMSRMSISKLPVLEKDELAGIITSTDLVRRNQPKKLGKDRI